MTTLNSTYGNLSPSGYADSLQPEIAAVAGRGVTWEIFNEPNKNFPGTIGAYEALLYATAVKVHQYDASATVLSGGTDDIQDGYAYAITVSTSQPVASVINGTAIHPYGITPSQIGSTVQSVQASARKPVYVTEWGVPGQGTLWQAMESSSLNTPLFVAYDFQTESNDTGNFGLLTTGQWQTFCANASVAEGLSPAGC